jgi:hypothetical protein
MLNQQQQQQEYLLRASKYDMMAQFYKYSNPELHIKYYKKHLKYLELAIQAEIISRNPTPFIHTRFINLMSTEVDLRLNDTEILKNVPPNGVSEYFVVPTNFYHLEIYSEGSSETPLRRQRLELKGSNYTTAVITENDLHTFSTDQFLPENETKLRVIHLSENSPSIDVRVKKGDAVFSNVSYSSATDYLGLTPMMIDLELTVTKSRNTLLSLPKITLHSNEIYSLLIIGDVSKGLKTLLVKD